MDRIVNASGGSTEWETPDLLFRFLDKSFGPFSLDAAACETNAKCAEFIDKVTDSFLTPWWGTVFLNPPYGRGRVLEKWGMRVQEQLLNNVAVETVVMLVPARTETIFFQDIALKNARSVGTIVQNADGYVFGSGAVGPDSDGGIDTEVYFIKGRLAFLLDGKTIDPAPFPSAVVRFSRGS